MTRYFAISFSRDPRNDFGVFALGYFHAASSLARDLLSQAGFPDYDVYPVVFLYRHSFELYLKNVIYQAAELMMFKGMDKIDWNLYNLHKLPPLAQKASAILGRLFPRDKDIQRLSTTMRNVASELAQIDPISVAYRYPIDHDGNASTEPNQVVDLEALSQMMDDLLEKMDTLDFGLEVETSQAQSLFELLRDIAVPSVQGSDDE